MNIFLKLLLNIIGKLLLKSKWIHSSLFKGEFHFRLLKLATAKIFQQTKVVQASQIVSRQLTLTNTPISPRGMRRGCRLVCCMSKHNALCHDECSSLFQPAQPARSMCEQFNIQIPPEHRHAPGPRSAPV